MNRGDNAHRSFAVICAKVKMEVFYKFTVMKMYKVDLLVLLPQQRRYVTSVSFLLHVEARGEKEFSSHSLPLL